MNRKLGETKADVLGRELKELGHLLERASACDLRVYGEVDYKGTLRLEGPEKDGDDWFLMFWEPIDLVSIDGKLCVDDLSVDTVKRVKDVRIFYFDDKDEKCFISKEMLKQMVEAAEQKRKPARRVTH